MNRMTITRAPRPLVIALTLGLSLGLTLPFITAPPPAAADTAPVDPANPATPVTVSADALPTTQIDRVAWAQVVVGNTVYVTGDFSTARPAGAAPGVNTVTRNNLLAYNIETGQLISSFNPSLNAQGLAIAASPDGSRIYVGGDFTAVNGQPYYRIVAISTATGQPISSFRPIMGSQVRALAATNTTVYAGGTFQSVNGEQRRFLAQMNASDGSLTSWRADADAMVYSMTLTKDGSKLIAGGRFQNVGTSARYGLAAMDAKTGAVLRWAAGDKVRNAGSDAAIMSLHATEDRVYGSGYVFGSTGNLEGIFSADPDTGEIVWIEDCHGDTVDTFAHGDAVYAVGHAHYCGNIGGFPQTEPWTMHHSIAFSKAATGTVKGPDPYGYFDWGGNPAPSLLNWFPNWIVGGYTGQGQASWSITGNDRYVVAAGEFPYVNGVAQYGLTRFAVPSIAPNKVGPVVNTELVPTAVSFNSGEVRVSWIATYDRDNTHLRYRVVRDNNTANPVFETTQDSTFWIRPAMGFVDTGLTPGATHTYRVYVTDPWGNEISRLGSPVTVSDASASGSEYSNAVRDDDPYAYWPLDESSGSIGFDHSGFTDLSLNSGVTRGFTGPVTNVAASRFNGTGQGYGSTATAVPGPDEFTVEAWFRTTSTQGGKIIGFGNSTSGDSTNYDRHVYMDNAGRIWFGVHPGGVRTVNSSASFNNGQWHHVAASLGANGMRLYVDGVLVGSRSDVTSGQAYSGHWRVGGDNLNGWTNRPSRDYFSGDLAHVAIYPDVLSRTQLINHWVASGRTSPLPPAPADAYGAAVYKDDPVLYWRLDDTSGTTAADSGTQENPGTYSGSVLKNRPGALSGGVGSSATFTTSSGVGSQQQFTNPTTYSLELWFKTTTNVGGKLIGFGDQRSALSSNYDRHLFMQDNGTLVFGVWTGEPSTITSAASFNDGQWHHAVAMQSSAGMSLYVDGALVGTNPQTSQQPYSGYWRIGGDSTWSSSSPWFAGSLDEVAVYADALSAATVVSHYALGTTGAVPNSPPTAAFTSKVTHLSVAFDSAGSSDTDGTIESYEWDFGDGATATGPTATHVYSAAGDHVVTLTVTDDDGAQASVSHTVTTTQPPVNQAPVAAFSSTSTGLTVNLNGGASTDGDGSVVSWAWDFGDGSTGTGKTTTHLYSAAGTYAVTLTVTDNDGATGSITHNVAVTAPTSNVLAQDAFARTVANGWGTADVGGAWSLVGAAGNFAVSGGTGNITIGAGSTRFANLASASSNDVDARATIALNAVPTGSGAYATLIGRQVGSDQYAAELWLRSTGAVHLLIKQGATILSNTVVPGLNYTAGLQLNLRSQVQGTSPTTLRAKVWPAGQAEPGAWLASVTDSTAGLQSAGHVGVKAYLAGSATSPITIAFDNLVVTTQAAPPANKPPVAAFTTATSGLTANFNASGSTDPDGTITGYAWNFGDGSTGSGATPSHPYATAGTYTVTLTVTDNAGATNAVSHNVTVSAPPAGAIAADDFSTAVGSGWGAADAGGAWSHAGTLAAYTVADGTGRQIVPAGSTKTSTLNAVSSTSSDVHVEFSTLEAPTGGGMYVSAIGRTVGSSLYQARLWFQANGALRLQLMEDGTVLHVVNLDGLGYTVGDVVHLRVQVFGTSPTTLRARAWLDGKAEPTTWQGSTTSTTAALQAAGGVGLRSYVSASATTVPVTIRFDNLQVTPVP